LKDDVEIYCMNQVFRPKNHFFSEGVGNCTTCKKDGSNKNCKNYRPIRIVTSEDTD